MTISKRAGLAIAALSLAALHAGAAGAETNILFNVFVPPKHPFNVGMFIPWAKDVEAATKGRVKVEFASASLAPPPKQWNMVTKGIADAAMLANIFERNRLTLPPLAQLPFSEGSAEKRGVALWRAQRKFFDQAGEYKGVKLLGQWTLSGSNFYHTKKAITSIGDLQKEKMWAIAGVPNRMMSEIGSVVVSVPGVEMFNVVSKGIVDGTVTSGYTLNTFKLMPYIKFATIIPGGFNANTFSFLFSQQKWDKMSKEDRDAVWSVSGERIAVNAGRKVDQLDAAAHKQAKEKGVAFTTADAGFVAAMNVKIAFFQNEWLDAAKKRGIDGPAALAYFRSQLN